MVKHTAESIQRYSAQELKNLRANAFRLKEAEVVTLCDSELERRKASTKVERKVKSGGMGSREKAVHGFHFVCPAELDVSFDPDGNFRTGIWAVAATVAERALTIGAYVALHNTKSEFSYRQGTMRGWRQLEREGKKIPYGVEFIVAPSETTLPWRGDGAGERGYYYGEDD